MTDYLYVSLLADQVLCQLKNDLKVGEPYESYAQHILYADDYYFEFCFGDKAMAKFIAGKI